MTLVAVLFSDQTPLVVTDSLISAEADDSTGVSSPLLDMPDNRRAGEYLPHGLARKFWQLPGGALYFYSGSVGAARQMFDHISNALSGGQAYSSDVHANARDYLRRIPGKFSFVVVSKHGNELMLWPEGQVKQIQHERFGCVALLGSGKQGAITIMDRSRTAPPNNDIERMRNAYEFAARLTLDYVETTSSSGSLMSSASCGGYFEVVETDLYQKPSTHLYRGTAHIFLDVCIDHIRLTRFVASRQNNDATHILSAAPRGMNINCDNFTIDGFIIKEHNIKDDRQQSWHSNDFSGKVPFSHIRGTILYATMIPSCGIELHSIRTHHVIVADGIPSATIQDSDDDFCGVTVQLFSEKGGVVQRIAERLRSAAIFCSRCAATANI